GVNPAISLTSQSQFRLSGTQAKRGRVIASLEELNRWLCHESAGANPCRLRPGLPISVPNSGMRFRTNVGTATCARNEMLLSQILIGGVFQPITSPDSNSGSRPALDSELLKDALHVLFHSTEMNNELHRRGTSLLGWGCVCQTDLG